MTAKKTRKTKKAKLSLAWPVADFALPAFVVAALLLGGASAAGAMVNLLLQIVSIVVLAIHFARKRDDATTARVPPLLRAVIVLAIAWPLAQLIPLPPAIWHALPGRGTVAANDALLGMGGTWRPISLQPNQTIAALLAMLVPAAAFVLALKASDKSRWTAIGSVLVVALMSSLLGILQIAQGPGGQAYLYEITNDNTSVGFFSNSNHLATLFLLAAACALSFPPVGKRRLKYADRIARLILLAFFLLNAAINRSLAGLGIILLLFAYLGIRGVLSLPSRPRLIAIGIGALAFCALCAFVLSPSGQATISAVTLNSTDPSLRLTFYRNTIAMFRESFPFGTGLGSFRWAYAGHEDIGAVINVYANHTHSDYLELASDLGVVGPILIVIFGMWYVTTVARARRAPAYFETAAVGIAVIALHSLVDYPARTAAIATVGAMFVALMIRRPDSQAQEVEVSDPQTTPLAASAAE